MSSNVRFGVSDTRPAAKETASRPCMTVDVEDFHEGMAVLRQSLVRPEESRFDLGRLASGLEAAPTAPKITLFVVAGHAERRASVRSALRELDAAGHEIASHGPDHGRFPESEVVPWLRKGREMLEEMFGIRVRGFRSPRFDMAPHGDLIRYREELAEAGYEYVSDTHLLGTRSAVKEAPVLSWRGLRVGGGSYQRLMPLGAVAAAMKRSRDPAVLYYHSYDFDQTVPGIGSVRSVAMTRQVLGRKRIARVFSSIAGRFGSQTCSDAIL
jgi:Domain of unknown function (DUF3473)/Polysaccharide deacetylase